MFPGLTSNQGKQQFKSWVSPDYDLITKYSDYFLVL